MLQNRGRSLLSIEFLEDPFPTNLALSGALIESTQAGEFMMYNLDAIRATGATNDNRNKINKFYDGTLQQGGMQIVDLHQRSGTSSTSLPSGIFHIAQRPGTNQIAVTTVSTEAHILRLQEKESLLKQNLRDTGDDADMMDIENGEKIGQKITGCTIENGGNQTRGSAVNTIDKIKNKNSSSSSASWEIDIEYNLEGHTGGCAAVRVCNDRAVTACFDGYIRVFELPPPTSTTTTTNATNGLQTNNSLNYNLSSNSNNGHKPEALYPVCTFMDDPEHAHHPPLSEQNRGVCGLALSSSAHRIVSGSNDMQIKVWDTTTGRITLRLGGCMGWPWWVEGLDTELNAVTSASTDGFVRIWDLRAGVQSLAVNLNSDPTASIFPVATVLPRVDGNYLVAGCFDRSIYLVDRRMGRVVKDLRGHRDRLARLALRGDTLLSCAFDGDVGLWDFE